MDHPRRLEWDLAGRVGGTDRERLEEVTWVSHVRNAIWVARPDAAWIACGRGQDPRGGTGGGRGGGRHVRGGLCPPRLPAAGPGRRSGPCGGRRGGRGAKGGPG